MTLNTDNIPVFGPLGPLGPKDTYPTHFANFGRGGFMQVNNIEELNAIPDERRVEGLHVLVSNTFGGSNSGVYVFANGQWDKVINSAYSTSYGPAIMFSDFEPLARSNGALLGNGDLWINNNDLSLSAYSLELNRWILLSNLGGGSEDEEIINNAFPGIKPRFPEDILPISSDAWDNGTTTLTASGCIQISLDNVNYGQGPLEIEDTDVLWTRWAPTEQCSLSSDGTLLEGVITNGVQVASGSITLSKVPQNFNFSDLIDQQVSSVSSSNTITLMELNASTKIWAPSGTGTAREVSINGGSWVALPSSFNSALTVPYQSGGPTIRVRHTNSASISTESILQIRVGDAELSTQHVSTTWGTTTVSSGPTINQPYIVTPVNNAISISVPTTVTSSAYSAINGAGVHAHSDWQVNSGAIALTSTASITSSSFINTDLGYQSWERLYDQYSMSAFGGFTTWPTSVLSAALAVAITGTRYIGNLHKLGGDYLDLPSVNTSQIRCMSYSPKLNIVVDAPGIPVLRYKYGFSSETWTNISVDMGNADNKVVVGVQWSQKFQKFFAFRYYENQPGRGVHVLTSVDGITFTLTGQKIPQTGIPSISGVITHDFGDFVYFYSDSGSDSYICLDGTTFINLGPISLNSPNSSGSEFVYQVRDKYVSRSYDYVYSETLGTTTTTVVRTSDDFQSWSNLNLPANTLPPSTYFNSWSSYDKMITVRAPNDALFINTYNKKTYYTHDGVNFIPLNIEGYTGYNVVYAVGGYYYAGITDNNSNNNLFGAAVFRAPRTMINLSILGANSNGFTVGQRIRVDGVPLTYGWIHSISSTTVTIRGAHGDWSNVTGRTISTDIGDSGLGLIVNLVDNVPNKTSYTVGAELMDPYTDYYSRVRYGDGSMKSSWSPWSKFTTGA